jgi:hypothetical protein
LDRREEDRPELRRLALLRLELFRPPDREEDPRALLRAELRPPRLADLRLDRLADRRALFLAPLREDFLLVRLAARRVDFLRGLEGVRPVLSSRLLGDGSSKSNERDGDVGEGEGVLSEGSGSIQPEPDQPISI